MKAELFDVLLRAIFRHPSICDMQSRDCLSVVLTFLAEFRHAKFTTLKASACASLPVPLFEINLLKTDRTMNTEASDQNVHSVLKALKLLEVLNLQAITSLDRLHELTGMPKPTIVRLLNTLIAAGYIERVSRTAGYSLTEQVLRISAGYRHSDQVVQAARQILLDFTARYKWPVLLATYDRDAMVLRFSTKWQSPFADHDGDRTNTRIPILKSAPGLAYLGFCPDDERKTVLALLRASPHAHDRLAQDARTINRLLSGVRKKGYSSKQPSFVDPFAGLGIPIRKKENVLAALSFRYMPAALDEATVVRRYLAPLQDVVEKIETTLVGAAPH